MVTYILKVERNTESKKLCVEKTIKRWRMILSKGGVCDGKKSRFIKKQKTSDY